MIFMTNFMTWKFYGACPITELEAHLRDNSTPRFFEIASFAYVLAINLIALKGIGREMTGLTIRKARVYFRHAGIPLSGVLAMMAIVVHLFGYSYPHVIATSGIACATLIA